MPVPKDVSQLRSFLGQLSYYGKFVKKKEKSTCSTRCPSQGECQIQLKPSCEENFHKAKSILSSDLLLAHYDPSQDIVVAAVALNHGLGIVISRRYKNVSERAIAHASHLLFPALKLQPDQEGRRTLPLYLQCKNSKRCFMAADSLFWQTTNQYFPPSTQRMESQSTPRTGYNDGIQRY